MPISKDIRRQIVALARRPHRRMNHAQPGRPIRWRPGDVLAPNSGFAFTNAEAWDLIASLAEEGHDVEVISLEKPEGAKGYVMKTTLALGEREIYMKVELRSGWILGRSFHYSESQRRRK